LTSLKANDTNQNAALPAPRQGFAVPGSGYGAGCGEKRVSFQRTGLHASRILVAIQGCRAVAMRFNYSQLLLDLGEKGVYSFYTLHKAHVLANQSR
jgi:hypothetical protein